MMTQKKYDNLNEVKFKALDIPKKFLESDNPTVQAIQKLHNARNKMITWKKSISNVDVINCYVGTWLVASIKFYSGDSHFGIETNLPGLNRFQGSYHDLELAKDKVEDMIIEWLDKAGLTFKKDVTL